MESLDIDVARNIVRAIRKYGFFIFGKEQYSAVHRILSELSNRRVKQILKVRPLSSDKRYYILEPDNRAFIAKCRDECLRNGVLDESCYIKCKKERFEALVKEVLKALSDAVIEG